MKIEDKLRGLRRRYPKVTKTKYGYKRASDLKNKSYKITVWYLIYDPILGHSLMKFDWRRAKTDTRTVKGWAAWLSTEGHRIFIENILPAVSVKQGSTFSFRSIILWTIM